MNRWEVLTRVREVLMEFVERASKKGATPEEVEALPGVARALVECLKVD